MARERAIAVSGVAEVLPTEYVDGVRGIASFYVVLNHARFLLFISAAVALGTQTGTLFHLLLYVMSATRYGVAGVMCFFIVSGYAIHYRQAFKIAKGWQPMSWKDYAIHRARRLYPPLLAAIALTFIADMIGRHLVPALYNGTAAAVQLSNNPPSAISLLGTLTFVQGFVTTVFGSNDPLWSLAYEGFFYLMYPLVLGLSLRLGPVKTLGMFVALGLSVAAIIGMGITAPGLGVDLYSPLGIAAHSLNLLAMWPAWVAGAFIADVRAGRVQIPMRVWSVGAVLGLLTLVASGLYLVLKNPGIQINDINIFYLVWVASFFFPIGWLCAGRHGAQSRRIVEIAFRPLRRLGAMSYSLYVIHFPILALICAVWLSSHSQLPRSPWLMLGGIVAVLVVAYGVYRVAERPFTAKRDFKRAEIIESPPLPEPQAPADVLSQVANLAASWTSARWRMPSQVMHLRELGPAEFGIIPALLGSMPERVWQAQMRVLGQGGAPLEATTMVALHQGALQAIEPPAR
jgi:peptidoglycan/LPS O-acetylase OafA/YrhL